MFEGNPFPMLELYKCKSKDDMEAMKKLYQITCGIDLTKDAYFENQASAYPESMND